MTRLRLTAILGIVAAGMAIGGSTGAAQTSPVEKAVMQAIDAINGAFQRRDVKTYESLTTTDFVRVTSAGRAFSRGEWLKTVGAPGTERRPGKYDEVSVRVYGDGAVVTYRNLPTGPNGQAGVQEWLTRVMVREGAQWKMALAQSTGVKPPAASGSEPAALPAFAATSAAEREALTVFQAIQQANGSRDLAAWERLTAPDHALIGANGTRSTRAQRVANFKAPAPAGASRGTPAPPDRDVRVIVKGDVAAVTWVGGNNRSLKVLARRAGQWQQVLQQASPIVPAK